MKKKKFSELFKRQKELEREILLVFSKLLVSYMTENYKQYVTDHIVEDHNPQHYMTIEDHMKDHPKEQYVTSDQQTILIE